MAARVVLSFDDAIVKEVELSRPVTVVGRHPDCDIVIEHPAISGRHMLFRLVDRTVYVEDLASTNGIKVNGISVSHQVVHHLDMIEIGRHKMHFFDDTLMAGGVRDLEDTVLTDYERTMLAAHVAPQPPRTAAAEADLSRTMAIPRDPSLRAPGTGEARSVESARAAAPTRAAGVLALRVISGERAGSVVTLDRANTLIGTAGGDTALVVRRGDGFFLARFSGSRPPRLNRGDLGPGSHPIAARDVIDVGGFTYEVIQVAN